jgi:hypothetical protein
MEVIKKQIDYQIIAESSLQALTIEIKVLVSRNPYFSKERSELIYWEVVGGVIEMPGPNGFYAQALAGYVYIYDS